MIKLDHDELKDLAETQLCAEHKTPVVVAWHSGEKCWTLRCGEGEHRETKYVGKEKIEIPGMPIPGHYPDHLTRQLSITEEYKAGEEFPEPVASNIKKSIGRRFMQNKKGATAVTFTGIPATDLGTGELLVLEMVKALMDYAYKYDLDPYRGHVVIMYGKPYIGLDGYLYYANRSGKPYKLESRPLTTPERADYQVEEGTHAWIAYVKTGDGEGLFSGLGIVTQQEMTAKSEKKPGQLRSPVVAAHPWQLAQKRAEWQALRRAFPIGESEEEKGGTSP